MSFIDILFIVGAYLLGSVSSAIIVCRLMGLPDPRSGGSGNPGATNVLRLGGKKAAAITLLGDSLKGFVPVFLAMTAGLPESGIALVGLAAFLGHLYPLFFGFQGGKGVATAFGVYFGLDWRVGILVMMVWITMALVTRISSLSALVSMTLATLVVWYFHPSGALAIMAAVITVLLIWRHKENIRKLLSGEESRISKRDKP